MTESPAVSATDPVAVDKPRRRVPMWVLWTTLVVMLVLTLLLSVWLPWQRKLRLIKEIESHAAIYDAHSKGPEWLRELFGYPYRGHRGNSKFGPFDEIVKVDFGQGRHRAATLPPNFLSQLILFPELEKLDLGYSNVTDDWMPQIAELKSLRELSMAHCKISGRGFGILKSLPQLEVINLAYCPLSDAGLQRLGEIPSLKTIGVIRCSRLTPDGIEKFKAARPDVDLYGAP